MCKATSFSSAPASTQKNDRVGRWKLTKNTYIAIIIP